MMCWFSSYSPSQQCCYGSNGDILTGTDGGSAYSVYPNNWKSFLGIDLSLLYVHACYHNNNLFTDRSLGT